MTNRDPRRPMRQTATSILRLGVLAVLTALTAAPGALAQTTADAPAARAGVLTTTDGIELAYEVHGAGDPALVLVHCWACDRQMWREQVDVFAADHKVVTMDLAGHGASGAGRKTWTVGGLAADVAQLVQELGLDDFVFVGHSMGGPVALLAATGLEGRVAGLVCIDTLHDLELKPPPEQAAAWIQMFENDFAGSLRGMVEATLPGESNGELRDWVVARALETDRAAALGLMRDFSSLDLAADAEAAGVPIRCINAAMMQNQMPADAVERNRKHADYQVTVMAGVGHFLLLEKPAEFNQLLRDALASLAGPTD